MGRKSTDKIRRPLSKKMTIWVDHIIENLQDQDLTTITLDDIAAKTNISKSTIYEYFPTKESILLITITRKIEALEQFPIVTNNSDILEVYLELINWLRDNLNEISFDFMSQLKTAFPKCWELVSDFTASLIELLTSIYTIGIQKGVFKDSHVQLMVDLDEFFILRWLSMNRNGEKSMPDLINAYLDMRLNGILVN
jgi:AcrR family transcriptional regulator